MSFVMYKKIPILPKKLKKSVEFSDPGSMQTVMISPVRRHLNSMCIREFLDYLGSLNANEQNQFNIWNLDPHGKLNSFGESGRRMVRGIAHYLRSLHTSSLYCGDVFHKVHIETNFMTVTFPFQPVDDRTNIRLGIQKDTEDFRRVVAQLISKTNHFSKNLPIDLQFFFSGVFSTGLKSHDLFVVKQHSFLQLFHPATFNDADKFNFIHATTAFRNDKVHLFEMELKLEREEYELEKWMTLFENDPTLDALRQQSCYVHTPKNSPACGSIPWFLRCLHHHFLEHEKRTKEANPNHRKRTREEIFEIVHERMPGVYSKILDAVQRSFAGNKNFDVSFPRLLEDGGFGFKSDQYRM